MIEASRSLTGNARMTCINIGVVQLLSNDPDRLVPKVPATLSTGVVARFSGTALPPIQRQVSQKGR
jgi:hypothetical protein